MRRRRHGCVRADYWFRRPRPGFAMRSTGWLLYAGVLCFLVAAETIAAHIALAMWKPVIAWISTISSVYALVWLAGDAQAIRLYPVAIAGGALRVTIGVRWRAAIPLTDITAVTETQVTETQLGTAAGDARATARAPSPAAPPGP